MMRKSITDVFRSAFTAPRRPSVLNYGSYETLPAVREVANPRMSLSASLLAQGNVMMGRGRIHDETYINKLRDTLLLRRLFALSAQPTART